MEFRRTSAEAPSLKRETTNPFTQHMDTLYQEPDGFIVDVENVSLTITQLRNAAADKGYGVKTRVVTAEGETHPTQKSDSKDAGYVWLFVGDKRPKAESGSKQSENGHATETATQGEQKAATKGTKGNK